MHHGAPSCVRQQAYEPPGIKRGAAWGRRVRKQEQLWRDQGLAQVGALVTPYEMIGGEVATASFGQKVDASIAGHVVSG